MTDVVGLPASDSAQGRSPYQESRDLGSAPALPSASVTSREPLAAKLLEGAGIGSLFLDF